MVQAETVGKEDDFTLYYDQSEQSFYFTVVIGKIGP
tara:strand:- start:4466 stop:4573 length:108 start_codon:yes stop_codon:yes gene_type:complete